MASITRKVGVTLVWILGLGLSAGMGACLGSYGDDCAATATCPDESGSKVSDKRGLAEACLVSDECASSHCIDGRCCESACDGTCERCDVPRFEGLCRAIAEGEDPDSECSAKGEETNVCRGVCNGNRACAFPDGSTVCGDSSCADGVETGNVCDGTGGCIVATKSCGQYACGAASCKKECGSGEDCADGGYCEGGECRALKANGAPCQSAHECSSGICAGGTCCSTECGAPSSCSTGECLCGGATCENAACTVWQLDQDRDGYPATSEHDVIGCADQRPPSKSEGFYYDGNIVQADCDDDDRDVHPGQTAFFTKPRKNLGGYDYNCDGKETRQYGAGGIFRGCSSCKHADGVCTVGLGLHGDPCDQLPHAYNEMGTKEPDCGKSGTLLSCTPLADPCNKPISNRNVVIQGCR